MFLMDDGVWFVGVGVRGKEAAEYPRGCKILSCARRVWCCVSVFDLPQPIS